MSFEVDASPEPSEQFEDEAECVAFPPVTTPPKSVHARAIGPTDSMNPMYAVDATLIYPSVVPGLNTTPVKAKFLENPYLHKNVKVTQDSVLGYARLTPVDNFDLHYLQDAEADPLKTYVDIKLDYMKKLKPTFSEAAMYPHITRLLTRICLLVCKDSDRCLAFYNVATSGCIGNFEGSNLKPDIVAQWTTRANAQKIVAGKKAEPDIYWHDIQSLVEVKSGFRGRPPSVQAGQYLHVLPRGLPSLAGMLYLTWDVRQFFIYWSDTSGILRSFPYDFKAEESWDVLYRYVYTVANPLTDLPTRDPTMSIITKNPEQPRWDIICNGETYNAVCLFGAPSHSRQTSVLWDAIRKRVIKDHWRDEDRRYNESKILEKIKGVPGVGQVDFSEVVKRPGDLGDLSTSKLHSGGKCTLKIDGRRVPRRTKQRAILKSKGDPLSERKSVRQIVTSIYDAVEAHQACLKHKRVLHRDISRYNILINPEHHDTELDNIPGAKFINRVLDPTQDHVQEEGILIDWDNAADLEEGDVSNALAERTGTPMFVSIGVGMGNIRRLASQRRKFPMLTGEAKHLYVQAYGQETYDKYLNAVNQSETSKDIDAIHPQYRHKAYHDIESFFWVLLYELLVAWPEGNDEDISEGASSLIHTFENHNFSKNGPDFRESLLAKDAAFWRDILHPKLACLAETIEAMCLYLAAEWAYWPELPEDHAHEAFKRLLLIAILELKTNPIPLFGEERNPQRAVEAIRGSSCWSEMEEPISNKRRSSNKRSHTDMNGEQELQQQKRSKGESSKQAMDIHGSLSAETTKPDISFPKPGTRLRRKITGERRKPGTMGPPPDPVSVPPQAVEGDSSGSVVRVELRRSTRIKDSQRAATR